MRLREQLRIHQKAIRALALAHGARDVRVFGSVARGDDGPESDIDFLVALEKGRTLFDLARLEIELERLLQAPVDVSTERELREPVRSVALREAIRV
jgi:predicted nucleotidyltransferase